MALPPCQEQRLESKGFARLPDEVKTKIIIMSSKSSEMYPAVCVNRACRDALWTLSRRMHIKIPVDTTHQLMSVVARGTLRAVRVRAQFKAELDERSACQGNSHGIGLTFKAGGLPADFTQAAVMQAVQTSRIGLVLHSMDAGARRLIRHLAVKAESIGDQLHLPALPRLTYLCLYAPATAPSRAFFVKLDLPQLQELWVGIASKISLEHTFPPTSSQLRIVTVHVNDQSEVDASRMPDLPKVTELHATSLRMPLSTLLLLAAKPLSNLQALSVRELVPPEHTTSMPAPAPGARLGALSQVYVTGATLSLSLVARMQSAYGVHVSLKPSVAAVMLTVGDMFEPQDGLDPQLDAEITEMKNNVLPTLVSRQRLWGDEVFVYFPNHQVDSMVQTLGPRGWLPRVRLLPGNELELCDNLRHLRLHTPPSVPTRIQVLANMPPLVVAQLFAQCWPELPQDRWVHYAAPQ